MPSEKVHFISDKARLVGTLHQPDGDGPFPAIVVVHPANRGETSDPFFDHLRSELPRAGIAVMLFDRRGSGESEGHFATADFVALADDVVAAVDYLQSRPDVDKARIGLHGTSQGGWIAPIAAARRPDIALIVAVAASGVSPADQMDYGVAFHLRQAGFDQVSVERAVQLRRLTNEYFRGNVEHEKAFAELSRFEKEPWFSQAYLFSGSRLPIDVTQSKWYHEMDYEPLSVWQTIFQPSLFLFAEMDEWVPTEQSMSNYQQATSHLADVSLVRIPGTDHLMRDRQGAPSAEYLNTMVSWLRSRLRVSV